MEQFTLVLPALALPATSDVGAGRPALCGVVSSGNLEVLIEAGSDPAACTVEVNTSAHGFRDIWEAVLADFAARHPLGGLHLAINDAGATPAVVSLRLDQAFETFRSDDR